jgi:cyanophycinase
MALIRFVALVGALLAACIPLNAPAGADTGRVLIVGGALSLDNEAVYRAFIDNRPAEAPNIAIIAAASADSASRAAAFAGELMFYGVSPENIRVVHLALTDDPDTPDVDESEWASNADNAGEIAKIENAGAIWFTGGDQLRLTQALIRERGADSPMLAAIRARLASGAIIGGMSAAAMSRPMIARGDAFGALFGPVDDQLSADDGRLIMTTGLRLFSPFTVDQHFGQRGRLGRLARAIMEQPRAARIGIGIDEDTALLVNLADYSANVIGRGALTLLDGRRAVPVREEGAMQVTGLLLSRLHGGDSVNLSTLAVSASPEREAVRARQTISGGLWPSVELLRPLEGERRSLHVIEQRAGRSARFEAMLAEGKRNARFTFRADRDTGYWRGPSDQGWNGTLTGVRVSISSETTAS